VSGYGLDDREIKIRSPTEAKDFSSSLCVQTGSGAHPASCPVGTGDPFPGDEARPGRDADDSHPCSAGATLPLPQEPHGVWWEVKLMLCMCGDTAGYRHQAVGWLWCSSLWSTLTLLIDSDVSETLPPPSLGWSTFAVQYCCEYLSRYYTTELLNRPRFETLLVTQRVRKFSTFNGNVMFITMVTSEWLCDVTYC
jgi:hypothetical protein